MINLQFLTTEIISVEKGFKHSIPLSTETLKHYTHKNVSNEYRKEYISWNGNLWNALQIETQIFHPIKQLIRNDNLSCSILGKCNLFAYNN